MAAPFGKKGGFRPHPKNSGCSVLFPKVSVQVLGMQKNNSKLGNATAGGSRLVFWEDGWDFQVFQRFGNASLALLCPFLGFLFGVFLTPGGSQRVF